MERSKAKRMGSWFALTLALALAAGCTNAAGEAADPPPRSLAPPDRAADPLPDEPPRAGPHRDDPAGRNSPAPETVPETGQRIGQADEQESSQQAVERTTYDIDMVFQPAERKLTGVTVVQAQNRTGVPTDEIRFNAYLNAFRSERLAEADPVLKEHRARAYPADFDEGRLDVAAVYVDGASAPFELRGDSIVAAPDKPWEGGEWRTIRLEWEAVLPRAHLRFGASGDAYWFGNALPILAVYDGEWRDYPYTGAGDPFFSEIADYHVRIAAPEKYVVTATGTERRAAAKQEEEAGALGGLPEAQASGMAITIVDAPLVREFAFALSASHKMVEADAENGMKVRVHYRNASERRAKEAAKAAAEMAQLMTDTVGEMPYGETDIFENEMFITGMEYPGLVFVRADRLNAAAGLETVVHEVAHQWFYNVVGNDQVMEPWLDEAFATYFADWYLLGDRMDETYAERLRSLRNDARFGSVAEYGTWSAYWNGNYRKGSLMLHALRGELGEEGFRKFVREYYDKHRFGVATTASFIETAEDVQGEPLDAFFDMWGLGDLSQ